MLGYPENTAGARMVDRFIARPAEETVFDAIRAVRNSGLEGQDLYTVYVLDASERAVGALELRTLLAAPDRLPLREMLPKDFPFVRAEDEQALAAQLVRKYDLIALPVLDDADRMLGAIRVTDIVDVIEEENTEDLIRMAAVVPSDDTYMNTSVWSLAKNRMVWSLVLMLSAMASQRVISHFSALLLTTGAAGIAVAAVMPMIMDTGGNCGSQSSTTVIRSMALGEVGLQDTAKILWKEFRVAILCGLALAVVNFARLTLLQHVSTPLSVAISVAMLLTVLLAKTIGCTLPLLAGKLKLDPALMAGPLITTIVDVCSLFVLFSLAELAL